MSGVDVDRYSGSNTVVSFFHLSPVDIGTMTDRYKESLQ
jgi:hypothetical protein